MIDNTILRTCRKCGQPKPITEYYKHLGQKDGLEVRCKECVRAYSRQYRQTHGQPLRGSRESGRATEQNVIDKLNGLGIFATSGKTSPFPWADVVAWGCVRIEVKTSVFQGRYNFGFTPTQIRRGVEADLILLVCVLPESNETTYHLFPSDFEVFYHNNRRGYASGRLKAGVHYVPDHLIKFRHHHTNALTTAIMDKHQNAWELIEQKRRVISLQLMAIQ